MRLSFASMYAALAFMACLPASTRAAGNGNLGLLKAGVDASMANLALSVGNFQSLKCLSNDAKNHLENVQTNAALVSQSFSKQYADYVSVVNKPMQGNGKCDGGFNSVATESNQRRVRTEAYAMQMYNLQMQYATAVDADFTEPTIDLEDESSGQSCSREGDEMYDTTQASAGLANSSFNQFRSGVATVAERFRAYSLMNTGLGTDCGSLPTDLSKMFLGGTAAKGIGNGLMGGVSHNPTSTITGELDKSSLRESGDTVKLGVTGTKIELTGGTDAHAGTSLVSQVASPAALAHAEREAAAQSFASKLGPAASGDNHAETLELQAMISGAEPNRAPAAAKDAVDPAGTRAPATSATPGACFETEKCIGKPFPVKAASDCPPSRRWFKAEGERASCERISR